MTSLNTPSVSVLPLRSGVWLLDQNHSNVAFSIRHLGIAKVRGRFTRFDAEIVVGDTPESSHVTATIDLDSVDTGNEDRDRHIRSADIVDVATRPTLTFRSTDVSGEDDRWTVAGVVTIGEHSHPVTLDVELGGVVDFPLGGPRHAGVTATAELRRSDFGIASAYPPPMLGDTVKIELDLELLEPGD